MLRSWKATEVVVLVVGRRGQFPWLFKLGLCVLRFGSLAFRGKRNESHTMAGSPPGCDLGGAGSKTPNIDTATLGPGPCGFGALWYAVSCDLLVLVQQTS